MRVELSLRAAEDLVRRNVFAAKEVRKTLRRLLIVWCWHENINTFRTVVFVLQISVQLTKVLLHMEDKYSIKGFLSLRQATMVAITVTDCVPVRLQLTLCIQISLFHFTDADFLKVFFSLSFVLIYILC